MNIINIEFEGQLNFQTNIYSLSGKLIISESNSTRLNVGSILTGTYLLEIIDLEIGERIVEKIVIAR